jgi:hypothetical protein
MWRKPRALQHFWNQTIFAIVVIQISITHSCSKWPCAALPRCMVYPSHYAKPIFLFYQHFGLFPKGSILPGRTYSTYNIFKSYFVVMYMSYIRVYMYIKYNLQKQSKKKLSVCFYNTLFPVERKNEKLIMKYVRSETCRSQIFTVQDQ